METTIDSKTVEDDDETTTMTSPDLTEEVLVSTTSKTAVPELKETDQEAIKTTEEPIETKTIIPDVETTRKPIIDKVVDFLTTTLKSVMDKETTQAPEILEGTTHIPDDEMEIDETEVTTMQVMVTDTRDKMPRLDDEIPEGMSIQGFSYA